MMQKHSVLIHLIKLLEDAEKFTPLLVPSTEVKVNKGTFIHKEWGPVQSAILVYGNLLAGA